MPLNARQANLIVKLSELNHLNIQIFMEFIVKEIEGCTRNIIKDIGTDNKKKVNHPGMIAGILSKIIANDSGLMGQISQNEMNKVNFWI